MANPKWKGCVESKVTAPLEIVWKITVDFFEIQKWFPGMKSSKRVEGFPEQGVGSVRRCVINLPSEEGSSDFFFVEELIAQEDSKYSWTIRVTDTDLLSFMGYEGTVGVCETGEHGNCLLKWAFEMNPIEGRSIDDIEALWRSIINGMTKNLERLASSQ